MSSLPHGARRYRYAGKERDEESGLYYFGARYYAPWLGRFLSVDPKAGEYIHQSTYCYAANNPVTLKDVNGEGPGDQEEPKQKSDQDKKEPSLLQKAKSGVTGTINRVKKGTEALGKLGEEKVESLMISEIIDTANDYLPNVAKLTEVQKQSYFRTDVKATIAILLYEFATGTGMANREFGENDAISKAIMNMDVTQQKLEQYYQSQRGRSIMRLQERRIVHGMSPTSDSAYYNARFSFSEHKKLVTEAVEGNPLRLFLGSMTYTITPKGGNLIVSVDDSKSRRSLFFHADGLLGIAKNVKRQGGGAGSPLSTTTQHYSFVVKIKPRLEDQIRN